MGKLMEKLGVERFSVVGTSYGGFVAYNMAKMLPDKVEKVVLASSGVNMRRSDNEAFIARAKCHGIAEVMLPSSGTDLRRFSGMISTRRLDYVPDFVLNDFCQVFLMYLLIFLYYIENSHLITPYVLQSAFCINIYLKTIKMSVMFLKKIIFK